ncbi:exonuclease SbcCD subunit D C-terminal domain-containing protein [Agitococcus lubricus]|uniref:Nuclease SbcCD subunit D n=1 Tax=Agitococcus lubricus TaxID=1077255 RepID=A0A2T5IYY6_9GAMM|nr:exonuclease SbcCD subunit D C-terminal domain-containing protein [Agitococcus lubricus]PTQ89141.1 exodeoxyribonuclease I subunit D [Agitococcus lubricus]
MRLLHTSDWHLGQNFFGFSRYYEHQQFLDWLLNTLTTQNIDVLLIAGDIFDTANPPSSAQQQFYQFLCLAKGRIPHLQVVIIAGNHDSPTRLEVPTPFLNAIDMRVVGQVQRQQRGMDLEQLLVPLYHREGEIAAWCLAIPFLRPNDVPRVEDADDAYLAGINALYQQVTALAKSKRAENQALIAMGHCHLMGGEVSSDSERKLVMGGLETLSSHIFDTEIAYVALGHLHFAQAVGAAHIRYSGSPLPMSFSEMHYPHQVVVIDLEGNSLQRITPILIPRTVNLQRLPEKPAPLADVLTLLAQQDWPLVPEEQQTYLQVRVLLDKPEPALRHKIEQVLQDKAVRLVKIETSYPSASTTEASPLSLEDVSQLQPEDVFLRMYQQRYQKSPDNVLLKAFHELLTTNMADES